MAMTTLLAEEWFPQNGFQTHQREMSPSFVALLALFLTKQPVLANKSSGKIEAYLQSDVVTALSKASLPEIYVSKSQCSVAMEVVQVQALVPALVPALAPALAQALVQAPVQVVQEMMDFERRGKDLQTSLLTIRTPMGLQNILLLLLTLHLIHC